ncbi:DUF3943 domain-containing protein [uncultured Draconibacterium sp.]|uniref:DUF3943 domain-containing protein n=1 Tax=uncultured Draconibacterium sp. TaxID=1573823 RepID=UPI003216EA13
MISSNSIPKLLIVLFLLFSKQLCAQSAYVLNSHSIVVDSSGINNSFFQTTSIYNPARDGKRLLINTGVNMGMSLVKFGVLWVCPESFSEWNKDGLREKGWCQSWKDNVKAGPVKDCDCFFMNGIMHPWGGAVYYMSARGSGFTWWESFIYSGILSTFMWEYGIEAFMEVPSWQDLIVTPVAGSALGECFYLLKGKIVENDKRVLNSRVLGVTSLILMDPVNEITDALGYKTKHKVEVQSSLVPLPAFDARARTVMGLQVQLRF